MKLTIYQSDDFRSTQRANPTPCVTFNYAAGYIGFNAALVEAMGLQGTGGEAVEFAVDDEGGDYDLYIFPHRHGNWAVKPSSSGLRVYNKKLIRQIAVEFNVGNYTERKFVCKAVRATPPADGSTLPPNTFQLVRA